MTERTNRVLKVELMSRCASGEWSRARDESKTDKHRGGGGTGGINKTNGKLLKVTAGAMT